MLALSCPCPQRLVLPSPSCTHMTLTLFFYIHFQRGGGGEEGRKVSHYQAIFWTPAGCPTIQLNSDAVSLEIVRWETRAKEKHRISLLSRAY